MAAAGFKGHKVWAVLAYGTFSSGHACQPTVRQVVCCLSRGEAGDTAFKVGGIHGLAAAGRAVGIGGGIPGIGNAVLDAILKTAAGLVYGARCR